MSDVTIEMRFHAELNDFLPPEHRQQSFAAPVAEARSVKDLIEAQQVPHTEVEVILVDGQSVGFDHLVHGGERVAVFPVQAAAIAPAASRLDRPPLPGWRFIADVHLGTLVRRLRLLGFDCLYEPPWDDAVLAQRSATERRILLTRDRRLLMRSVVTHGGFLHSDRPEQQLREVVRRFGLAASIEPMSRCSTCNGRLESVTPEAVRERIPPKTWLYTQVYYRCTHCSKLFWKGTHWPRLESIVRSAVSDAAADDVVGACSVSARPEACRPRNDE